MVLISWASICLDVTKDQLFTDSYFACCQHDIFPTVQDAGIWSNTVVLELLITYINLPCL